jgi:hypothetical protein
MSHEDNKHLVHRLVEIVNERDFDSIDEVATGQIASEAKRWVGPFRDSFPDFHMEVIDVIAGDPHSHPTSRSASSGEWSDSPSSRRQACP